MSKSPTSKFHAPSATLWLLDGSCVGSLELASCMHMLGADEMARYRRFVRPLRQRQFLLGRMLLRRAIAAAVGVPSDVIGVVERPGNAPQLILPDPDLPLPHFSISHSRNWVVCATSIDTMLGVDIEFIDPARDILGLAESGFHPDEYAWLLAQPENRRPGQFYHLWSLREALYKLRVNANNADGAAALPPLAGVGGVCASQGDGWHAHAVPHPEAMLIICSADPLCSLDMVNGLRGV